MMPHEPGQDQRSRVRRHELAACGYGLTMTTSPAEPVDNDQSGSGTSDEATEGISDEQLPEDLRPGPDNPLASKDGTVSEAPKPGDDDAVPEGEEPPGDPSIG